MLKTLEDNIIIFALNNFVYYKKLRKKQNSFCTYPDIYYFLCSSFPSGGVSLYWCNFYSVHRTALGSFQQCKPSSNEFLLSGNVCISSSFSEYFLLFIEFWVSRFIFFVQHFKSVSLFFCPPQLGVGRPPCMALFGCRACVFLLLVVSAFELTQYVGAQLTVC